MIIKQAEALDFIKAFIRQHGYSPSYDEIACYLGLASKQGVHRLVTALKQRGHITLTPRLARSIAIVNQCPHCGSNLSAARASAAAVSPGGGVDQTPLAAGGFLNQGGR